MGWFRKNSQKPKKKKTVEREPAKHFLSYQVANLQGIGNREQQEDSFAFVNAMDSDEIEKKGLLAVIADGMGGLEDGKQVSETAIAWLLEAFHHIKREEDIGQQLRACVYQINDRLYQQFSGSGGTTLIVCVFYEEKMYFVSVGDSFLYLKRGNGIYRLNQEQTYRQELYLEAIQKGSLNPSFADANPEASCLSEYLGKENLSWVDTLYQPWILKDKDVLLLCSDGVGGVLSEQVLLTCLKEATPEQMLEHIEQEIKTQHRVHQDNYTALVIVSKDRKETKENEEKSG